MGERVLRALALLLILVATSRAQFGPPIKQMGDETFRFRGSIDVNHLRVRQRLVLDQTPNCNGATDKILYNATLDKFECGVDGGGGGGGSGDISDVGSCATGACFTSVTANQVLASPAIGTGAVTPRGLVDDDIPGTIILNNLTQITTRQISDTTGTLAVGRGGTGNTNAPNNSVLVGNGTGYDQSVVPDCSNGTTGKMLYNATTRLWSCGVDQAGSGGGIANAYASFAGNLGTASAAGAAPAALVGTSPLTVGCADGAPDTCTISHTGQTATLFLAGPTSGAAAPPTFRQIAGTDLVATSVVFNNGMTSTDNALCRFDGASGLAIQDSSASLSDAGTLTIVGQGQFIPGTGIAALTGTTSTAGLATMTTADFVITQSDDLDATDANAGVRVSVNSASGDADTLAGYTARMDTANGTATEIAYEAQANFDRSFRGANPIESTLATGTAPFIVASTTVNTNLNADLVDGRHGTNFVDGPASAADNGIARFDGTTGKLIQDGSTCTLSDLGLGSCAQHPTDGDFVEFFEGADDGTNVFRLEVPNSGLTSSATHVVRADARLSPNIIRSGTVSVCAEFNASGDLGPAAAACGSGGSGPSEVDFVQPFGPSGSSTANFTTADLCTCWRFAIPYSGTPGIPSVGYDVTAVSAGDISQVGIYSLDGSVRLFVAPLVVTTGTGVKLAHNTGSLTALTPGEYWACLAADDTGGSPAFALRLAGEAPQLGPTFTQACSGGTAPTTITPPAQPYTSTYQPASLTFTIGTSTSTTTTSSTTSSTAAGATTTSTTSTTSSTTTTSTSSTTTSTSTTTTSTASGGSGLAPTNWLPSMLAAWRLNETSGTRNNDAEGTSCGGTPANCDLTDNNTVTQSGANLCPDGEGNVDTELCEDNGAASFDQLNTEFLSCTDATCATLDLAATNATFGCIVNPGTGGIQGRNENRIMGKGTLTTGYGLWFDDGTNQNQIYCQVGSGFENAVNQNGPVSVAVSTICTFVTASGAIDFYENGLVQGVDTGTGTLAATTVDFQISSSATNADWDGQLDECFVDNATWTAEQAARVARCGVNGARCCCDATTTTSYRACTTDSDCRVSGCSSIAFCDVAQGECSGRRWGLCAGGANINLPCSVDANCPSSTCTVADLEAATLTCDAAAP